MTACQPATSLQAARFRKGWSKAQLIVALRSAARMAGQELVGDESLKRNIASWENGHATQDHFYRSLLCAVYQVTPEELGFVAPVAPPARAPTSQSADTTAGQVVAADDESSALIHDIGCLGLDSAVIEQAYEDAAHLAVAYLTSPPGPMLTRAQRLRAQVIRLNSQRRRPKDAVDLYLITGLLSGVMAYAALDGNRPREAMAHARVAFQCGDMAGHNGLRAWARGTQSLIARFEGDYRKALGFVRSGLPYATDGTSRIRLLCGQAQCLANLGDSTGAVDSLAQADGAREAVSTPDAAPGLFTFSATKQLYYSGSSLIWLPEPQHARRAEQAAEKAIGLFRASAVDRRADQYLAHVYLATARVNLGNLDGVLPALAPVLELPPADRISWIRKRLARVASLLDTGPARAARPTLEVREAIAQF